MLFGHERYFISTNCADLRCAFVEKLRDSNFKTHPSDGWRRPGEALCIALGGQRGDTSDPAFVREEGAISYCVFASDGTFVSLSLLESWRPARKQFVRGRAFKSFGSSEMTDEQTYSADGG